MTAHLEKKFSGMLKLVNDEITMLKSAPRLIEMAPNVTDMSGGADGRDDGAGRAAVGAVQAGGAAGGH